MKGKVYEVISSLFQAIENCKKSGNAEWEVKHTEHLNQVIKDFLPSGSGWDCGTKLEMVESKPDRLVFYGAYHHMDEGGGYVTWTEHGIVVTPSLTNGFDLRIRGRDRNGIKGYLNDVFDTDLRQVIEQERREPYRYKRVAGSPSDTLLSALQYVSSCAPNDCGADDGNLVEVVMTEKGIRDIRAAIAGHLQSIEKVAA